MKNDNSSHPDHSHPNNDTSTFVLNPSTHQSNKEKMIRDLQTENKQLRTEFELLLKDHKMQKV
jgi:hypothetical protein